jgi:hypothetical protein
VRTVSLGIKGAQMEQAAKRIKLPFWKTVADSYRWGLGRLPEVIAKFWLVLLALTVVTFALYWLIQPYNKADGIHSFWLTALIMPSITGVFIAMIAVPWHRFVINSDPLTSVGLIPNAQACIYAACGIAVLLPFYASFPLFAAAFSPPIEVPSVHGHPSTVNFNYLGAALIAVLLGVYISTRICLKLVAVALRDPKGTFAKVWQKTSWSFWRLFWGTILTFVPELFAIFLLPEAPQTQFDYALWNTAQTLISTVLGMVPLTFLSLAYQHLMMPSGNKTAASDSLAPALQ